MRNDSQVLISFQAAASQQRGKKVRPSCRSGPPVLRRDV